MCASALSTRGSARAGRRRSCSSRRRPGSPAACRIPAASRSRRCRKPACRARSGTDARWVRSSGNSTAITFELRSGSGVVEHALEVDHHGGLVADHPRIVTRRQERDVARLAVELGAVVHLDAQHAGDVVLEVRRLAALGAGERLHRGRPAPAGLEHGAPDGGAADVDQLDAALGKFAHFIRLAEILPLGTLRRLVREAGVVMAHFCAPARTHFSPAGFPSLIIVSVPSRRWPRTTPRQRSLPYCGLSVSASKARPSPESEALYGPSP